MVELSLFQSFLDRIRAVFPDVDTTQAIINTDGLMNVAIIIGDTVYRFARSAESASALKLEADLLAIHHF